MVLCTLAPSKGDDAKRCTNGEISRWNQERIKWQHSGHPPHPPHPSLPFSPQQFPSNLRPEWKWRLDAAAFYEWNRWRTREGWRKHARMQVLDAHVPSLTATAASADKGKTVMWPESDPKKSPKKMKKKRRNQKTFIKPTILCINVTENLYIYIYKASTNQNTLRSGRPQISACNEKKKKKEDSFVEDIQMPQSQCSSILSLLLVPTRTRRCCFGWEINPKASCEGRNGENWRPPWDVWVD